MPEPIAVLVEDDPEQAQMTVKILTDAGFDVRFFESISSVTEYFATTSDLIDLFVLDRRLPMRRGEISTDGFGDELLRTVRDEFADAKVIVFTGHATVPHVVSALGGNSQLPTHELVAIDRITVLEKDKSLEFRDQVRAFRGLLQSLDDIEIRHERDLGQLTRQQMRQLRRLAFEFRASSIHVKVLGGGLTTASVWRCSIDRPEGVVASVVAKTGSSAGVPGGLSDILPSSHATATTRILTGLLWGKNIRVLQVAGRDPIPLGQMIEQEPDRAVSLVTPLLSALSAVESTRTRLAIQDLCAPLLPWDELVAMLRSRGIKAPAASLQISTATGARHGDLHPENILVDSNQCVLIDFDSEVFGAGLLDPLTLFFSTLTHPDSPLLGSKWPNEEEISARLGGAAFASDHPQRPWFVGVMAWIEQVQTSEREYWAIALAYATRQLRYENVTDDPETVVRVLAIIRRAVRELSAS